MGVQVYTNDDNHEVLQDLTISLQNFNLHGLLSVLHMRLMFQEL